MTSDRIEVLTREIEPRRQMVARFRLIFDAIPDGVLCADHKRRMIMVNPAAEALFGYSEMELLGRRTDFLYSSREDFLLQSRECFNGAAPTAQKPFEAIMKRKDGTTFAGETVGTVVREGDGEILCFLKLIRDISGRRKLENGLRHLELTYRTVADFTYDWECWTQPDGKFRYVSPSCLRLTGHTVEDFMTNPALFRAIIHPDDQPLWDEHHRESKARIGPRELQFRIVRADGAVRWIEHACQPVRGDHDELLGFRSSNRDITKRKNYEEELHKALSEIRYYKERLEAESAYLREEMKIRLNYGNIVGSSNALKYVFFKIEQVSKSDASVLLLGETGTGKELFARLIHDTSPRKKRSLVKVNCATLPQDLIESALFGHEKGSFTGAHRTHMGRFELADKGTIFLDEIGEMPVEMQAKLLRVLQEGEFESVGSSRTTRVDVRIIAATNRDLEDDVRRGLFRQDLWYRLNVFPITAPALRDRVEDIPQLAHHFVGIYSRRLGRNVATIPEEAMQRLENYSWPGNVRELENVIERAVLNSPGSRLILADALRPSTGTPQKHFLTLEEMERNYITEVLEQTGWKVSGKNGAAEILGMKRSTLRSRMDKFNILKP